MKITTEQFQESFFYIAPGKDFEPLLRFSNHCRYFLYANLGLSKDEILDYINRFFNNNPFLEFGEVTQLEDFDMSRNFELHAEYISHVRDTQFLDERHRKTYESSFDSAKFGRPWMIKVDFKNRRLNRPLTLYYFAAEGLNSYVALSHNGAYSPKILATIETKVLEWSNGIMLGFFERLSSNPAVWIRGFEGSIYDPGRKNNSFKLDSIFSHVGMDFAFNWDVEGSYPVDYLHERLLMEASSRFCKAFIKEDFAVKIVSKPFKGFGRNAIMYADLYTVASSEFEPRIYIIATRHFDMKKLVQSQDCRVVVWEDIMEGEASWRGKFSMEQSLHKLSVWLKGVKADKVYFTPFGMEDEGPLLSDFLSREFGPSLVAVVNKPLDLIDLREN